MAWIIVYKDGKMRNVILIIFLFVCLIANAEMKLKKFESRYDHVLESKVRKFLKKIGHDRFYSIEVVYDTRKECFICFVVYVENYEKKKERK